MIVVKCTVPGDGGQHPGERFYHELLEALIRTIWDDTVPEESVQVEQLLKIESVFFEQHLPGFLQSKRMLETVGMDEALEIYMAPRKIESPSYIGYMLSAFDKLYHALDPYCGGSGEETASVYAMYARINIARKIREVFRLLDKIPTVTDEDGNFTSITYCSADFLLSELSKLYGQDPRYAGTLFLAARVCQDDPSRKLEAGSYYQQMLCRIAGSPRKTYSFLYYEYGLYAEKVNRKRDLAIQYYAKTKETDPLNYRARFELACHEARNQDLGAAEGSFKSVILIIGERFSGGARPEDIPWENLSLRDIQYMFRTYVWLWKISLKRGRIGEAMACLDRAGYVIGKYKENALLGKIHDPDSMAWAALMEYHGESGPVRIFRDIVDEGYRRVTGGVSTNG